MKLSLAAAVAVAALAVAPAAARAADLTTTVSGPNGVVWSGPCPQTVAEQDIDTVTPLCRALDYSADNASYQEVVALGGTTLTDTLPDGTVFNLEQITAAGHWVRTNYLGGGSSVVTDCVIVGNAVTYSACTRTAHPTTATTATAAKAKAKARKPAKAKRSHSHKHR